MADKKKMSVEDILAACRGSSENQSASPEPGTTATPPAEAAPPPAAASDAAASGGKSPSGKPAGQMSVADILAAARAGAGGASSPASDTAAGAGGKPAAPAKPAAPGSMSVADILAAARGGGSPAPKPAAPKAAPAAKAPPAAAAAKAAPAKPSGPMDTSSILASARAGAKPGPVSKAEAAARGIDTGTPGKIAVPPMPAKPAYAQAKPAVAATDRRGFLSVFLGSFLAIGFTSLGLTSLSWTLGVARFMFPNILIEPPSRFKVGFPTDFAPGSVADRFKAQFGIWIVNAEYEGAPQIVALKTVCTHLGCTPNWLEAEQKFKCPCHGSGFYKDGINFEGPAPRPLERYAIRLADDGQLEVDKSKTFQQEMGQWADPSCFVPV